jgi:hypothetical protein
MPLDTELDHIDDWMNNKKTELQDEFAFVDKQYWYLEQMSCILVIRNKKWFEHALVKIKNVWDTILVERQTGFDHRKPKQKPTKKPENKQIITENERTFPFLDFSKIELVKSDENPEIETISPVRYIIECQNKIISNSYVNKLLLSKTK